MAALRSIRRLLGAERVGTWLDHHTLAFRALSLLSAMGMAAIVLVAVADVPRLPSKADPDRDLKMPEHPSVLAWIPTRKHGASAPLGRPGPLSHGKGYTAEIKPPRKLLQVPPVGCPAEQPVNGCPCSQGPEGSPLFSCPYVPIYCNRDPADDALGLDLNPEGKRVRTHDPNDPYDPLPRQVGVRFQAFCLPVLYNATVPEGCPGFEAQVGTLVKTSGHWEIEKKTPRTISSIIKAFCTPLPTG